MDRKTLVDGLSNVDAARGQMQKNITQNFWFVGGGRLMAFNGDMALSVPFKCEFQGAVQDTILPLLKSSSAPEINFVPMEGGLTVKAGKSKFKLNVDSTPFLFKMPKMPEGSAFPVKDVPKFLQALRACKRSIGHDVSEPEFKGVTFQAEGKKLHLFGFNKLSLTHATVDLVKELPFEKVIVGVQAIDQLLRITEGATELDMVIDDKTLLAQSGNVRLWHRLEQMPRDARDFLNDSLKIRKLAGTFIPTPKKMQSILERACIITQSAIDAQKTKIAIEDNTLHFYSKSVRGIADETCVPDGKAKHPDSTLTIDPKLVLDGIELGSFAMTKDGFIWAAADQKVFYFVAGV